MNPVGVLKTIKEQGAFQHGTWGAKTIPELQAFGERIREVRGKRGLNAFSDTELDTLLRRHRIENLVIAGVLTSICIDSTGRTAAEHDYRTIILSDCTFGRTAFEQNFYCEKVFPIYSEVMEHRQLLESMRIHCRETLKKIEETETETQIQQRLFEELTAMEKRYRELIENLRNIVFRCDKKGVLTFVNPAWQALLGYPLRDSVGRPLMDFIYPKDRRGGWEELSNRASQGPHKIRMFHQNRHRPESNCNPRGGGRPAAGICRAGHRDRNPRGSSSDAVPAFFPGRFLDRPQGRRNRLGVGDLGPPGGADGWNPRRREYPGGGFDLSLYSTYAPVRTKLRPAAGE